MPPKKPTNEFRKKWQPTIKVDVGFPLNGYSTRELYIMQACIEYELYRRDEGLVTLDGTV